MLEFTDTLCSIHKSPNLMYTTIAQINLVKTERYTLLLTHVHISTQTQVCTCIYKDHPHSHTLNVITTHSYIRTHTDNIEVPTNAQQQVENTNEPGPIVNAPAAACSPIHTRVSSLTEDKTGASRDFVS